MILLKPAVLGLAAMGLDLLPGGATPGFNNIDARRIFGASPNLWYLVIPSFLVDAATNRDEIGWQSLVLPRLQARFSAPVSSLVLGAVWGLRHLRKF